MGDPLESWRDRICNDWEPGRRHVRRPGGHRSRGRSRRGFCDGACDKEGCRPRSETLKGDKERLAALISVLNVGFEQGGAVSRQEKRGERFVEVLYEVYAPRVIAGIAGLKDTLEDRALSLVMLRRRKIEAVARLGRGTDVEAQGLRDQCALACLARIGDIITASV